MTIREAIAENVRQKLALTHDPLWRVAAYWLVIIAFFSLPLMVLMLHLGIKLGLSAPPAWREGEFKYIFEFHRILAGLMAAMLGLNSWDKRIQNGGNGAQAKGQDAVPPAPKQ
jgi:hypothetical protein